MWLQVLMGAALALSAMAAPGQSPPGAAVFADLSPAELRAVRDFLLSRPELGLVPERTGPLAANRLFLVEMLAPKKRLALRFLDQDGPPPQRQARAVVYFAGQAQPNVTEYVVGPLPWPSYYRPRHFKGRRPVPFAARPVTGLEYELLHQKLEEATAPLSRLLRDTTGYWYHNCSTRCLVYTDVAPRGLAPGERRSWVMLQRLVEGYFLHPVGVELLLDHRSLDPRRWAVQQVWFQGRYFPSVEALAQSYAAGSLQAEHLPEPDAHELYSSYVPRGRFGTDTPTDVHGAKVCEPQGRRYRVQGNQVEYGGWALAFRLRSSSGLQLFDLRFDGARVAYELSVQEALAFYGGSTPSAMQTKFLDAGWAMGTLAHELAPGVDCPESATFIDAVHLYDAAGPVRFRRALCIFELPTGVPLRRHFNSDFQGSFRFYGGLEGTALVLRTTATVYNYDYIWDVLLYPNGVLEAKVHATGYIHATFYTPEGLSYGSRVQRHVLGNMHTHLVHYKVDLDVAGDAPTHTLPLPAQDRLLHLSRLLPAGMQLFPAQGGPRSRGPVSCCAQAPPQVPPHPTAHRLSLQAPPTTLRRWSCSWRTSPFPGARASGWCSHACSAARAARSARLPSRCASPCPATCSSPAPAGATVGATSAATASSPAPTPALCCPVAGRRRRASLGAGEPSGCCQQGALPSRGALRGGRGVGEAAPWPCRAAGPGSPIPHGGL